RLAGAEQGRQLLGELDQARARERPRPPQRLPCRRAAALARRTRFHRQVALLLEALRDLALVHRLPPAFEQLAARVERLVVVQGHGVRLPLLPACAHPRRRGHASSVTRRTSSIVVTPARALAMPSSYMVRMPCRRAICSISPMPAWRMTARRRSSSMTRNSRIVVRPR